MRPKLDHFLEVAYGQYARAELIASDPLQVPYRYTRSVDKEVAAFIAAGMSFGSVPTILRAADTALAPLGEQPADRLMEMTARDCAHAAAGFNHRWIFAEDLAALYQMLGGALREAGALEPLFADGMTDAAEDVRPGLAALNLALGRHLSPAQSERRGTRYFLSSAHGPGAAKRLHMFTRWMVRTGDVDMGLWGAAKPHQLIVPLDTHVGRIARYIGLTSLKSPGLAMALDITRSLRQVDAEDPVRFDFVLSRLGILGACPRKRSAVHCQSCALFAVCRL
jgi:uncharacterized protein (TIGR02757 family)